MYETRRIAYGSVRPPTYSARRLKNAANPRAIAAKPDGSGTGKKAMPAATSRPPEPGVTKPVPASLHG